MYRLLLLSATVHVCRGRYTNLVDWLIDWSSHPWVLLFPVLLGPDGLQSTRHTVNSTRVSSWLIYQTVNSTQVNSTQESTRHTVNSKQLDTYVNTQQFNCSAIGLCSRRKANISEDRLNRNAKVVCTCIFCWSCLPTRWRSLTCISCHPSQKIILQSSGSRPTRDATARLCH